MRIAVLGLLVAAIVGALQPALFAKPTQGLGTFYRFAQFCTSSDEEQGAPHLYCGRPTV